MSVRELDDLGHAHTHKFGVDVRRTLYACMDVCRQHVHTRTRTHTHDKSELDMDMIYSGNIGPGVGIR